jgi:hypothetical protein
VSGVAFRSDAAEVLASWEQYKAHAADIRERRNAMEDRFGRRLMVSRSGFGHGTRVVGFEEFEDDEPGAVLGDNGELRVPKTGPPYSTVLPNIRRKAGKDLRAELDSLRSNGPKLVGMPDFQLVGLRSLAPAIFEHDGAMWVMWAEDIAVARTGGEVDPDLWQRVPLSAFYAAKEAHEASEATS